MNDGREHEVHYPDGTVMKVPSRSDAIYNMTSGATIEPADEEEST